MCAPRRRLLFVTLAAALQASCSPSSSAPCATCGAPDAGTDAALEVVPAMYIGADTDLVPVGDGDAITLSLPPQGGHVLFVGARMRNLHTTTVELHARLLDADTNAVVAQDQRTVLAGPVPGGDPAVSQTNDHTYTQSANVTACPAYGAKAIDGVAYVLEVTVVELYVDAPRTAVAVRKVVPTCPPSSPDADHCKCECAAGYVLGKCPATKG